MSIVSKFLKKAGIPTELLDYGQKLINEFQSEVASKLPPVETLATRVKGNPAFKEAYRTLTTDEKRTIDKMLHVTLRCALQTITKVLGI